MDLITTSQMPNSDIIAVALMASNMHHFLTQADMDKIQAAGSKDTMIKLSDGGAIRFGSINDITGINEYYQQYPDKRPSSNVGQPPPRKFSHNRQEAITQLIQDWLPICSRLGFAKTEKLVLDTWQALENFKGSFEMFCTKHKALTPDGRVTVTNYTDDRGIPQYQPFAYPFFCAIRDAMNAVNDKDRWEDEHTVDFNQPANFEKIINAAPVAGVAKMAKGIEKYLAKNTGSLNAQQLYKLMKIKLNQNENTNTSPQKA